MTPSQQQVQQYIQSVLNNLKSSPDKLNKEEIRLATKYQAEITKTNQIYSDIKSFQDQIRQADARLRSLELQLADTQGKANAYLDYLSTLKFEDMTPAETPPVDNAHVAPVRELFSKEQVAYAKKNSKKQSPQPRA